MPQSRLIIHQNKKAAAIPAIKQSRRVRNEPDLFGLGFCSKRIMPFANILKFVQTKPAGTQPFIGLLLQTIR